MLSTVQYDCIYNLPLDLKLAKCSVKNEKINVIFRGHVSSSIKVTL